MSPTDERDFRGEHYGWQFSKKSFLFVSYSLKMPILGVGAVVLTQVNWVYKWVSVQAIGINQKANA